MADAESSQPSEPPKLSNAELKKRAKVEKQAKRAARKTDPPASVQPPVHEGPPAQKAEPSTSHQQKSAQAPPKMPQAAKLPKAGKAAPLAHRPSASAKASSAVKGGAAESVESVRIFNHLSVHRRQDLEGVPKETHPAVQALGLQMSEYIICGSTARCLAMLQVFKSVRALLYDFAPLTNLGN
jgi:translation initiation factor eIF-2B subunit delta